MLTLSFPPNWRVRSRWLIGSLVLQVKNGNGAWRDAQASDLHLLMQDPSWNAKGWRFRKTITGLLILQLFESKDGPYEVWVDAVVSNIHHGISEPSDMLGLATLPPQ